jgi:hypothetical protein
VDLDNRLLKNFIVSRFLSMSSLERDFLLRVYKRFLVIFMN